MGRVGGPFAATNVARPHAGAYATSPSGNTGQYPARALPQAPSAERTSLQLAESCGGQSVKRRTPTFWFWYIAMDRATKSSLSSWSQELGLWGADCWEQMWATKEVTHPKTETSCIWFVDGTSNASDSTIRKQKTPSPTGHRQYVVPEPGEKINDNATEAAPDHWISWHLPYCAAPTQRCGTFALGRPLRPLGDTSNIPPHPPEVRRKEGVVILYNSARKWEELR
ncbi:hypothetical protein EDB92DRAFT_1816752 [Lactarius akahatsu]|uniref:Uncharacterized protein n=1 Tax=Lactarius akahatsu TaxID=416441 RepID=A0AAD4Q7M0_9AGAM|nr:hypothetical protein EDB92DRAFT_1816752 [Lactarius akahatsu]